MGSSHERTAATPAAAALVRARAAVSAGWFVRISSASRFTSAGVSVREFVAFAGLATLFPPDGTPGSTAGKLTTAMAPLKIKAVIAIVFIGTNTESSGRRHTKGVRNVPARYTLRAFRRGGSDQQGAIPVKQRDARRDQRRGIVSGRKTRLAAWKHPRDRGGNRKQIEILRNGLGGGDWQRGLGWRRLCDAAIGLVASAAGAFCRRVRFDGLRHHEHLHPEQEQAQDDGGKLFHALSLAEAVGPQSQFLPSTDYFLALAASASLSFFRYLAGSFLKSFWQDLQQSLISWPS